MQSAGCVQRRRQPRNVQGDRGVAETAHESAVAGIENEARSNSGQTMRARIGGSHQRDGGRITRTNAMAPGLRGGPGTTRMVHPGVADIALARRTRIRSGVTIGVPARRGAGVPIDPKTVEAKLPLLSVPARILHRTLKMNDVDDVGRPLGVLRRTMHPVSTRTRGTTGAHTATALPADAGTDHARVPALLRKRLAQRRYRRG